MVKITARHFTAVLCVTGSLAAGPSAAAPLPSDAAGPVALSVASSFQVSDCRVEFPNFGSADSLLEATMRYLHDKSVSSDITHNLDSRKAELEDQLRWIGDKNGYLIDVRIGEAKSPGSGKTFIGAAFIGPGTTASAAYAMNSIGWSVESSPPSGYQLSSDDSFMVWIVRSGSKLSRSCIVGSARDQVLKDASVLNFSQASSDKLKEAEHSARYADLAQIAENRATSKEVRDRLRYAEEDRQKNAAALLAINNKLKAALDQAAAAASVSYTLGLLQGVLSVASMVNTAQSQLGADAPSGLTNATSPGDVLRILDVYKTETGGNVVTVRKELTVNVQRAQDSENKVRDGLKESGVPAGVLP